MNKITVLKRYTEPYYENKEPEYQHFVDEMIKTTGCRRCGTPYHRNLKVMWVDLHSGKILWWCISHTKLWNEVN